MIKERFAAIVLFLLLAAGSASAQSGALLADATEKQDRARIADFLKQGADVNAAQADGMTALHWAVYHDDPQTTTLLIQAGANAKAANRYAVTPLSLACTNGNTQIVEMLLKAGADPNTTLSGGESALMTAARTGKPGPVKALLARGADVNAKDRKGQTALMWAAAEGHADVVSALLAAKADFKTALASGFTPLLFAAREGRLEVASVLLKAGADVNEAIEAKKAVARGPSPGTSALCLAVENGHFELAISLVKAGADPNDQRSGCSPLHMISWVRKPNRGDSEDGDPPPIGSGKLTSLEFVKQLVALGAKVNLAQKQGVPGRGILGRVGATPLIAAASTSDVALVRTLLDLGADPKLTNADGTTPLLAATGIGVGAPEEAAGSEAEALEVVEVLVKLGADVNAVDKNGENAMHGAAYRNHPKVVQLLADKGASIEVWNRPNKTGLTPLVIAEGHRPGLNFRPSPPTVAAFHRVMLAAGVTPPKSPPLPANLLKSEYGDKRESDSTALGQWQTQAVGTKSDFRGLSVASPKVAWVSGTMGTYARTIDAGKTWSDGTVPGAEKLDFRDVEALGDATAYLLSAGQGDASRIYKTSDGGKSWTLQFKNADPAAFFDAIAFWDEKHGIALGDPVKGQFQLIATTDGGAHWKALLAKNLPPALSGEAAFAASGTCLVTHGESDVWFATGGAKSARVFHSKDRGQNWRVSETPIAAGAESAGIFSIAFRDKHHGMIVGGDYLKPNDIGATAAISSNGGTTWTLLEKRLPFRSAVAWAKDRWIAVGTSGSHVSLDNGATWKLLDRENYNSVAFTPSGEGWAVGPKGRIAAFVK